MMQYRKESCVVTGNGWQIDHLGNAIKPKMLIILTTKEERKYTTITACYVYYIDRKFITLKGP